MARPTKDRFFNGVKLEDNLYPDNKKRENYWRYKKPDGNFKYFVAETTQKANAAARKANAQREAFVPVASPRPKTQQSSKPWIDFVEDYILYRQECDESLFSKESWRNRCYELRKFAKEMSGFSFGKITLNLIQEWWQDQKTYWQRSNHAELRKLFNYGMGRNLFSSLQHNPFTTSDEVARLHKKAVPARSRCRLSLDQFWQVYDKAGELGYDWLQIAMGISLCTFMREGDVLSLTVDDVQGAPSLQKVINKSAAQKGQTKAARLEWSLQKYTLLKQLLDKAVVLANKNDQCPYLISFCPAQRRKGATKTHVAQVTATFLQKKFRHCVAETGLWLGLPQGIKPPTFHEIRSLSDKLASENGHSIEEIQHAMAHSDEAMTLSYQANHELPFEQVNITFNAKQLGRSF